MTAEPEDQMAVAAAGRGRLRASFADREHVVDMLKAAFVHGRITKDEFDARVGQAVATFAPGGPALFLFGPLCLTALMVAAAQILASQHEKRSRGQLAGPST